MIHCSPYVGTSAGHNSLSEPTCIILVQVSFTHNVMFYGLYLNLKREPSRVKSLWPAFPVVGCRSRKKAWLSTAHFHRCLQVLELASWNMNVCSCSRHCTVRKNKAKQKHASCLPTECLGMFVCRQVSVAGHKPDHRPPPQPTSVDSF